MPLLQVSIRQHNDYRPCQTRPDVGLKAQANLTMKKPWWTLGHEIPNAKSNSVIQNGGCLFHNWKTTTATATATTTTTTTTQTNFEAPTRFVFLYHHLGSPNQQRLQPTQSSTQRATDDIFQVDRPHGFVQQLGFCWSYTNFCPRILTENCVVLQYFPISIKMIGKKNKYIFQRKKRMLILK